jgi:ankyrin repeat protein
LAAAVDKNNMDAARILLDNGADVNVDNGAGTPLYTAADNEQQQMMQPLLYC